MFLGYSKNFRFTPPESGGKNEGKNQGDTRVAP